MAVVMPAPAPAWSSWHPGEVAVQRRLGLAAHVPSSAIIDQLPQQHRLFYATRLNYLPVVTLDAAGRPWASILTSRDGHPGFIQSDSVASLHIEASVWDGDPILDNLRDVPGALFAGVGVEPSSGRRNKFGGVVLNAKQQENRLDIDVRITYSLGLCPKYIAEKDLRPSVESQPRLVHNTPLLSTGQRLPADAIALILGADAAYLATTFDPPPELADVHKPRVGINHRGGRPGFVRVRNDGRTLVLPNYAGNRVLNSLGNIHCTPRAALVVPCLVTESVVYVTGNAETFYDEAARALMPETDVLTTLEVTGFAFVADALPLRYAHAHTSAYSPPVRYLAEEQPAGQEHEPVLRLVRAVIRSPTLTSYFFRASGSLSCMKPAGTVVLDLRKAFADQNIGHDDCVRTWTVSHPPTPDTPEEFGITLRTKADGVLTPLMAAAVRNRAGSVAELGIVAALRGTNNNIPLPNPERHLWIAGGIGATPFMALGRYIAGGHWQAPWDIVLLVSTSEPAVLAGLFAEAFAGASNLHLALYLFISEATDMVTLDRLEVLPFTTVQVHRGRIPADGALFKTVDAKNRHIHICGPLPFVNNAMTAMENAGVDPEAVFRERFTY